MTLVNHGAVVTGGSRGIGRAIALELARKGAEVVVNYSRSAKEAQQTVEEILSQGGRALAIQADVACEEEAIKLIEEANTFLSTFDILVNNAGINRDNLLVRMKTEEWEEVMDTNLKSAFFCTRAALKFFLRRRQGSIVNISSVVGLIGNSGQANYVTSKAGLIGFTKASAIEVASRGIRVNAVAPGYIETEMTANLPQKVKDELLARIPAKRWGKAEDVAHLVAFLVSPDADYINGEIIRVDGGMTS